VKVPNEVILVARVAVDGSAQDFADVWSPAQCVQQKRRLTADKVGLTSSYIDCDLI
jgi:hypothetical protein